MPGKNDFAKNNFFVNQTNYVRNSNNAVKNIDVLVISFSVFDNYF